MPDKYDQINSDIKSIRDARVCLLGILFLWSKENNKSFGWAQAGTNIGSLITELCSHMTVLRILASDIKYKVVTEQRYQVANQNTAFLLYKSQNFQKKKVHIRAQRDVYLS